MKKAFTTIATLTLSLIIIFGVNELLFAQNDSLLASSNNNAVDSSAQREILSLLIELRSIDIDDGLFQSNVFRSLKDFGVVLESQPVGRNNPFAPIGIDDPLPESDEDEELSADAEDLENLDLGLDELDDLDI